MHNLLTTVFLLALTSCVAPNGTASPPQHPYAWLVGNWVGTGMGSTAEEQWLPAHGKSMVGVFRLLDGDAVTFYELITIDVEGDSAVMRLKHFHPDLRGWEAQNEVETWRAEVLGEHSVRFGPAQYTLVTPDALRVLVRVDGQDEPLQFDFRRTH